MSLIDESNTHSKDMKKGEDSNHSACSSLECAVCLQSAVHPVQLPCSHIFCYLCVKGVAVQSKKCPLCRNEIPSDYLFNPILVALENEEFGKVSQLPDSNNWYYEGKNGWWQYDYRTSNDLEEQYKNNIKKSDMLIAGCLYIIDFENMIQYRRTDPTRRRKIKRDNVDIVIKGVAGLKVKPSKKNKTNLSDCCTDFKDCCHVGSSVSYYDCSIHSGGCDDLHFTCNSITHETSGVDELTHSLCHMNLTASNGESSNTECLSHSNYANESNTSESD